MKHCVSSENCEKEIKEILCVPEKEKCVSTFRIKCKRNKRYVKKKKNFLKNGCRWKEKFNKSSLELREFVDEGKISKSDLDLNIFRFEKGKKNAENYNCKWGWMPMVAMLGFNWKSKPPDSDIRRV